MELFKTEKRIVFQWGEILDNLCHISFMKQESIRDKVFTSAELVEYGLVGISLGRQAGASIAAKNYASDNNFLLVGKIALSEYRMCKNTLRIVCVDDHREEMFLGCDYRGIIFDTSSMYGIREIVKFLSAHKHSLLRKTIPLVFV